MGNGISATDMEQEYVNYVDTEGFVFVFNVSNSTLRKKKKKKKKKQQHRYRSSRGNLENGRTGIEATVRLGM